MSSTSPKFSIPSLLAILCAIGSFTVGAFAGLLLAIVAMVFGIAGLVLAFLPQRRGGVVSIVAVVAGVVGIGAAIVKGIAYMA